MMMGDVSVQTVRDSVESWREAVLLGDSVLGWQQEWHPAAIAGSLTAAFLTVWYLDPTLVTLLAILGLLATLADYLGPKVLDKLFKPESWTKEKENRLEGVCQSLVSLTHLLSSLTSSLAGMRAVSPLLHFSIVSGLLLTLAWLGTIFSGLFLLYVSSLLVIMLPGLHRRGLLEKHCGTAMAKLREVVKGKKLE